MNQGLTQNIPNNLLEMIRQRDQYIVDQQLAFGDNALRAFSLNLKILNHVKSYPEDSHLLGALILKDKIATEYIVEAIERGQQIGDAKRLKRRPRDI